MGWSGTSLSAGHIFVQALSEPKLSVLDILVSRGSQLREAAGSRLIKGSQFSCLGKSGFEESRDFPPTGIAGVWENVYGMSGCLVSPRTKHESTKKCHVDPRQFKQLLCRDRKAFKLHQGRSGEDRSTD